MMLFFVTLVGFVIHVYSVGYMHSEGARSYARYFAYLNLFMFAMLVLVLGANLAVLFVGWEGVGLCTYLLIGFYFEKDWCAAAGKKAFIVNRIGDFGFLLAIFWAFKVFGTIDLAGMQQLIAADPAKYAAAATPIALLLFVGAIGKSAQMPLYVWLPDAMAGPTPVSALIHAATMVTAGVYMVARCEFHLCAVADRAADGGHRGRGDGGVCGHHRAGAERHQEGAGVLDRLAVGVHVPRGGCRRLRGGDLPRLHARVLQGLPVPGGGVGDSRHGG